MRDINTHSRTTKVQMLTYNGAGVINSLINKLPFEVHVPGYQFCGPGTKLEKRLARGDQGINSLDAACKKHDIAYSKNKDLSERHKADKELEEAAWQRVKAKDSKFGEKATAWAVTTAMKIKRKLGMGLPPKTSKRKRTVGKPVVSLNGGVVKEARKTLRRFKRKIDKPDGLKDGINLALSSAKAAVKDIGGKKKIRQPRVIAVPKRGGILPLIPIFAGLSALGSLAGGAAGIAKAVNKAKDARKKLEESKRHNQAMESIALNKKGSGLYLKQYRKGLGLYLKKQKNY